MPYDPNNADQALHDPEHINENREPAPMPDHNPMEFKIPEEVMTLDQMIDMCMAHAMVRNQVPEVQWVTAKLHIIAGSYERKSITKDQAIEMMEHVYDNEITVHVKDEITMQLIERVVDWLRTHPGV